MQKYGTQSSLPEFATSGGAEFWRGELWNANFSLSKEGDDAFADPTPTPPTSELWTSSDTRALSALSLALMPLTAEEKRVRRERESRTKAA